jgi:hypothetical protein
MNHTPHTTVTKFIKDSTDLLSVGEICSVCLDLGRVTVLCRCISWECIASNLGDSGKSLGERVVVVVDREDLVSAGECKSQNYVRSDIACTASNENALHKTNR